MHIHMDTHTHTYLPTYGQNYEFFINKLLLLGIIIQIIQSQILSSFVHCSNFVCPILTFKIFSILTIIKNTD